MERALLTLLLGLMIGLAGPAWVFAQRLTAVEVQLRLISEDVSRITTTLQSRSR